MNLAEFILSHQLSDLKFELRYSYESELPSPDYLGIAQTGIAASKAAWTIIKFTYDGSNRITRSQASHPKEIWDNRTSVFT